MSVRVRYAPSPTGLQHIGGVRTALFNYFFARSEGGTFILRIEDTDRERFDERALQDIYDTFSWLGIEWDEGPRKEGQFGPYFQSERKALYEKYAEQLLIEGKAYKCFCTAQRLDAMRKEQAAKKLGQGYDRHCRNLGAHEVSAKEAAGESYVVRFKIPEEGATRFDDLLLGTIERENSDINPDPVLLKSDGFPTYHLANVIDDHLMEITHILRAQEWIPSGALHVLLYRAFGWDIPAYCHLPMVMGEDGHKLSKRHGSTSVIDFRKNGYLPEAILNYISLLGWSYDDSREFFTKPELEELFTLKKLNKAPAVFDYKKLEWFNGSYIRKISDQELKALILPGMTDAGFITNPPSSEEDQKLDKIVPLIRERLKYITEAPELVRFIFEDVPDYPAGDLIPKKTTPEKTLEILEALKGSMGGYMDRTDEENEQLFRDLAKELETKLGNLLMPLRIALTGTKVSPPLLESVRILGIEKTTARIDRAITKLKDEL